MWESREISKFFLPLVLSKHLFCPCNPPFKPPSSEVTNKYHVGINWGKSYISLLLFFLLCMRKSLSFLDFLLVFIFIWGKKRSFIHQFPLYNLFPMCCFLFLLFFLSRTYIKTHTHFPEVSPCNIIHLETGKSLSRTSQILQLKL